MTTNLTDIPLQPNQEDSLGVTRYVTALAQYIGNAQTPTTIAIQGEWGSGKTSFMIQLKDKLCGTDKEKELYHPVWINMWKYSLMQTPEQVLIAMIQGLTIEITRIAKERHGEDVFVSKTDKILSFLDQTLRTGCNIALKAGVNYLTAGAVTFENSPSSGESKKIEMTPDDLCKTLKKAINLCLKRDKESGHSTKGFIFFVDDLDRIDPELAVQSLEVIKNIMEIENCIFILAIDYEVVVKGLVGKFGQMTAKNERAFRSFFDKIIQLPFSMPVVGYQIDKYAIKNIETIGYFSSKELDQKIQIKEEWQSGNPDEEEKQAKDVVANFIQYSVGSNPRAIKRLFNSLSLINIIHQSDVESGHSEALNINEKLLNLGLVCIQTAYPSIYHIIQEFPNYLKWDENTTKKLHIKSLQDSIDAPQFEGNDKWKLVLFEACQPDPFLQKKFEDIVCLLELIEELLRLQLTGNQEEIEDEIIRLMGISSITDVSTIIASRTGNRGKDRETYESFFNNCKEKRKIPDSFVAFMRDLFNEIFRKCDNNITFNNTKGKDLISFSVINGSLDRGKTFRFMSLKSSYLSIGRWPLEDWILDFHSTDLSDPSRQNLIEEISNELKLAYEHKTGKDNNNIGQTSWLENIEKFFKQNDSSVKKLGEWNKISFDFRFKKIDLIFDPTGVNDGFLSCMIGHSLGTNKIVSRIWYEKKNRLIQERENFKEIREEGDKLHGNTKAICHIVSYQPESNEISYADIEKAFTNTFNQIKKEIHLEDELDWKIESSIQH